MMRLSITITAVMLVAAGPALAQDIDVKPLVEARTRYEHVDQDGMAAASDAVTIRLRAGVEATRGPWSVLGEAQGNLALVDNYYDGLRGTADRPVIGDPENAAIYRAQIRYRTQPLTVTAGRQRIALDDERFVGAAGFRNNGQTYDAVRTELVPLKGVKVDVTYAWNVRTIWGSDGRGFRQRGVSGDNVFANVSAATPIGTLTGFAYLVDQDEAAVQGYRLSNQNYGVRLAGSRPLGPQVKLHYQFSYASQSSYHRNPNDYQADYWLADGALDIGNWTLNAGYEVLGAGNGTALTSFQTPLGSVFKFQGWADKFTTNPPNGLHDIYVGGGHSWKKIGKIDLISFQALYHRFQSDRLDQHYGDVVNLLATVKVKKTAISARFARYEADRFATDTTKMWLQLDWSY